MIAPLLRELGQAVQPTQTLFLWFLVTFSQCFNKDITPNAATIGGSAVECFLDVKTVLATF